MRNIEQSESYKKPSHPHASSEEYVFLKIKRAQLVTQSSNSILMWQFWIIIFFNQETKYLDFRFYAFRSAF